MDVSFKGASQAVSGLKTSIPSNLSKENLPGIRGALGRLQETEMRLRVVFEDTNDPADYRRWLQAVESLRKVEQTTPDVTKAKAESVTIADVSTTWSERLAAFRQAPDAFPARLAPTLEGPGQGDIELKIREAINDVLEQLCPTL